MPCTMSGVNHPVFYAGFMLVVGLGIPIFAALNGDLGSRLNNPILAAIIALLVGIIACTGVLLISGKTGGLKLNPDIPIHVYLGGLFVVFYVLGITWTAPKFGVGNAVAFVLLGQLISMATIDHFGLLGAAQHTITLPRFTGLVLMAAGVFLAVRR